MPKLSICVPLEAQSPDPSALARAVLAKAETDLELVLAPATGFEQSAELAGLAAADARLRILPPAPAGLPELDLWSHAIRHASGDWLTLVRSDDMIEPELAIMAAFLEKVSPSKDALAWNALQIAEDHPPHKRLSVAIPVDYNISSFDKTAMLKAFFYWENSSAVPKMPFGLYHGLIRRSLAQTVLGTLDTTSRKSTLPAQEWAARVLLMASDLAFCARPMSAIATRPYPMLLVLPDFDPFPFHAGLGITAGIGEVQNSLLNEMGSEWGGAEENFIRACMIDCMGETDQTTYIAKCGAYFAAIRHFKGGRYSSHFQPTFIGDRALDQRRGLHGQALMIDRFTGGAKTAQDFYGVVRSILAPVRLICGGAAV